MGMMKREVKGPGIIPQGCCRLRGLSIYMCPSLLKEVVVMTSSFPYEMPLNSDDSLNKDSNPIHSGLDPLKENIV